MNLTCNLHDVTRAEAKTSGAHSWVTFYSSDKANVGIFMSHQQAKACADAFNAAAPQPSRAEEVEGTQ